MESKQALRVLAHCTLRSKGSGVWTSTVANQCAAGAPPRPCNASTPILCRPGAWAAVQHGRRRASQQEQARLGQCLLRRACELVDRTRTALCNSTVSSKHGAPPGRRRAVDSVAIEAGSCGLRRTRPTGRPHHDRTHQNRHRRPDTPGGSGSTYVSINDQCARNRTSIVGDCRPACWFFHFVMVNW